MVDKVPVTTATRSDRKKPLTSRESLSSAVYQRVEKPVKMPSWRVLLNEKRIRKTSGV